MEQPALHSRLQAAVGERTFRQLADLTGTHPETVRRYMHGATPSLEFVVAVCDALGVRMEWLVVGSGPMRRSELLKHTLERATAAELLREVAHQLERLDARIRTVERAVRLDAGPRESVVLDETCTSAQLIEPQSRTSLTAAPDGVARDGPLASR